MIRIKVNMYPPEGRMFTEKDGTIFRAGSWRGVIRKVEQYRKINNRELGNVEAEVMAQACQRTPSLCYDDSGSWAPPTPPAISLKARVLNWLAQLAKVTPSYARASEARRRAEICMRCPKQGPMEKGCATCKAAVKELRKANLRGRTQDNRLACCSQLGTDLRVAVWIDDARLNDPELPAECWRKVSL